MPENKDYVQIGYNNLLQLEGDLSFPLGDLLGGATGLINGSSSNNSMDSSFGGSSDPSSVGGSVQGSTVPDGGAINDLWITNLIRSTNWKPKKSGFYINGQSGRAEFSDIFVSGEIAATLGSIGGWTINATSIYTGTEDHSGYTANAGDFTIYSDGINASIHAKNFYIDSDGNFNTTAGVMSGVSISSIPNDAVTDISLLELTHNLVFSVTDADTIAWTAGTITLSNGRTFTIDAGNTGNMTTLTYVYLDPATSSTVLQTTTTYSTAMGADKVLIGVAQNQTTTASYIPFTGGGKPLLDGEQLGALSVGSAVIGNLAVTNAKINDLAVSKLTAGTITSKDIVLAISAGVGDVAIRAGKTDFTNTETGFILGLDDSDSDLPKFYIGNTTSYLNWTGAALNIAGDITSTSGSIGGFTIGTTKITATGFEMNSSAPGVGNAMIYLNPGSAYTEDAVLITYAGLISPLAIINNTADATPTDANASIWIDTNKSTASIYIDHNSDAAADAGVAMIEADQWDNANGIELRKLGTGAGDAINVENDGTGDAIAIKQDGSGRGIFIDNNGNDEGIYIDHTSASTSDPALYIDHGTAGIGQAIKIVSGSGNTDTAIDFQIASYKNSKIFDIENLLTTNANLIARFKSNGSGSLMQLQSVLNTNDNPLLDLIHGSDAPGEAKDIDGNSSTWYLRADGTLKIRTISQATQPTTSDIATSTEMAIWIDTDDNSTYLCINQNSAIKKVALS